MPAKLPLPQEKLEGFCRRNRIRRLALLGSVLRDDFGPDSDVDVLVKFEPGAVVGLFKLYDLDFRELSQLLGGRRVDVNTPRRLSKYCRHQVPSEAEECYVRT